MTAITVLDKANVPTGPFTREQIAEKLKTGECSLSDLAFVEGLTQWTPLGDVLAKVDGPALPTVVTPPAIAPAYSYAVTMQSPGHLVYAGFWLRFVAYVIDSLILTIPVTILFMILGVILVAVVGVDRFSHTASDGDMTKNISPVVGVGLALVELVVYAVLLVGIWLYFAKLESGPHQSTFGKRLLGLKVTDLSGGRIGFGQASGRFFGKIISGMILDIGFIMAAFTERKQALHDMIAGTLVVKK